MKYVIDRFEEDMAILEDEEGNPREVERENLPSSAQEGDVVIEEGCRFYLDEAETAARRDRIQKKWEGLFQ